ncbi:hypothetical protein DFQ30_003493 [Apophysomyces sp. BC1015]|nr:hypothetical protein DFQ30_003493 [Apophysomyces sp. BC1015]
MTQRLVPGHANIYGNKQAHNLAYGAAREYKEGRLTPREIDLDAYLRQKIHLSHLTPHADSYSQETDDYSDDSDSDSYMSVEYF